MLNGQTCTFVEAYCKLRDAKIIKVSDLSRDKYETDSGNFVVTAPWPVQSTLHTLTQLTSKEIDPQNVMWFYYDHDWSCDADECHVFFAVHKGTIVSESCHFSSEEPLVLRKYDDEKSIWHSHPHFDTALEIYWYRRFYTETLTGQLMVLRPDEPVLYHFERPKLRDNLGEIEFVTTIKLYRLLWVAVALLAAIAIPSLNKYMICAAIALFVDLLWRCWLTRKAGPDS